MYNETIAGMQKQITLIETALNRALTDEDDIKQLSNGIFYLNPDEIVQIVGGSASKISFFLLDPELQHDIFLNYAIE